MKTQKKIKQPTAGIGSSRIFCHKGLRTGISCISAPSYIPWSPLSEAIWKMKCEQYIHNVVSRVTIKEQSVQMNKWRNQALFGRNFWNLYDLAFLRSIESSKWRLDNQRATFTGKLSNFVRDMNSGSWHGFCCHRERSNCLFVNVKSHTTAIVSAVVLCFISSWCTTHKMEVPATLEISHARQRSLRILIARRCKVVHSLSPLQSGCRVELSMVFLEELKVNQLLVFPHTNMD
jgi:hypothetical protein